MGRIHDSGNGSCCGSDARALRTKRAPSEASPIMSSHNPSTKKQPRTLPSPMIPSRVRRRTAIAIRQLHPPVVGHGEGRLILRCPVPDVPRLRRRFRRSRRQLDRNFFRANRSGHRVSRHGCVEILSNSRGLGLTGRRVNRFLSKLEDGIARESELACAQFVLFPNAPARGFPYRGHRRGRRRTQHCGASARAGPCGHHPCRTSVATNRFRRSSRHVHAVSGFGRREVSPLGSDVPRSFACTGAPRGANCRSAIWTVSVVLLPATGATSLCGSFEPACRTGHAAGLCGGA